MAPSVLAQSSPGFFRKTQFLRGDSNGDGVMDLSDAVYTLDHLFTGKVDLDCRDAADSNADLALDISDAVYGLGYLFTGTPPPPEPGPTDCGVNPAAGLGCASYAFCPDDFPLIAHVLNRITFGPTEELYAQIQTRAQLLDYIEEQLDDPPADYDPQVHEPDVYARIESLQIGFGSPGGAAAQLGRIKASLLVYAVESRWQFLHVISQFWNNHFHTQIDALPENFFGRGQRGGPALRGDDAMFDAVDTNPQDGFLSEAEWNAFRALHPGAVPWEEFRRGLTDTGLLSKDVFRTRPVAYWKYGVGAQQAGVSADMEKREYDLYRRLAFGHFRDLADACAKSVAMLIYLNGFENTAASPNENFGREVFELFVKGVDHGYTQRDIEEIARVFTGWSVGWVARAGYPAGDINFQTLPASAELPLNVREPRPFAFPTQQFWEDDLYTWAYVVRTRTHDWERKDLFLQRYGGTDSLGNPLPVTAELAIPANAGNRTVAAALAEWNLVLDRLVSFRDTAKFISTKLIQLLVTDDLAFLAKENPAPAEIQSAFAGVDRDSDGAITATEWEEPVPLVLPNGRPPDKFEQLDENGDGRVTLAEYQEPDLLQACIDQWRSTGGDLREVLRTILFSEEFLSLKFYRAKVKTPFEVAAGALRLLEGTATPAQLVTIANDLELAGMELFSFADPTGESELGFDWMHTIGLLERLKYLNRAANPASNPERRFTWSPVGFQLAWGLDSAEEIVDFFGLLTQNGDLLESHRQLALDVYGSATGNKVLATVAYLLSLPEYQKQ